MGKATYKLNKKIEKVCIFSDIHGNGPAFSACYDRLLNENADLNIFLGDICGYYFDQSKIFKKLLAIPRLICVRGNHDDIFFKIYSGDQKIAADYRSRYGLSMEILLPKATENFKTWIGRLPNHIVIPDQKMFICHGSPANLLCGYVYPDSDFGEFKLFPYRLFILGHTHYPMLRRLGDILILNPGSVGQPRHGGPASYATLIIPSRKVEFHEFEYDKKSLIRQIDSIRDSNPFLKSVLGR